MIKYFMLFFLTVVSIAQTGRNAEELAQAERNFSATSDSFGINVSFLKFLSDDCVMFNPLPVNGKEIYRNRKESGINLTWHPTFVEVAHSGDFGISSGPWEIRMTKRDTPVSYGHYFSIWKIQKDGSWQLILDNGIRYPKESRRNYGTHIVDLPKEQASGKMNTEDISAVERSFMKEIKKSGTSAAYAKYSADNILFYRQGNYPTRQKTDALELLKTLPTQKSYSPFNVRGASSGDLAFTYGISVDVKNDSSSYARVWRNDGGWKIAVDVLETFK